MTAVRAIVLLLLTGVLSTPVVPQTSATTTIAGRVIDAVTRKPLRGATVRFRSATRGYAPVFITQADGRFIFSDVPWPSLEIELAASKPGYLGGASGQRRPDGDGRQISLSRNAGRSDVELLLWPSATISGRVSDDEGAPLGGVTVSCALASAMREGVWPEKTRTATSDERGSYVIADLLPGDYVIGIAIAYAVDPDVLISNGRIDRPIGATGGQMVPFRMPTSNPGGWVALAREPATGIKLVGAELPPEIIRGGRAYAPASTFYPGTSIAAQAGTIALASGGERTGIDLSLPMAPAVRVSGRIVDAEPSGIATMVTLTGAATLTTHARADGSFSFPIVPAGSYELSAVVDTRRMHLAPPDALPGEGRWGRTPVTVGDRDVDGLALVLRAAITLRGRVEFDTAVAPEVISALAGSVYAVGAFGIRGQLHFTPAATFASTRLGPGAFTFRLSNLPPAWALAAVEAGGRDHTDVPIAAADDVADIVVRVTSRPAAISGVVRDARGAAADFATVLIFPADPQARETQSEMAIRNRRQRATPTYEFADLPPGAYMIAAIDDGELAGGLSAELLARIAASAASITLGPGTRLERHLVVREK